MIDSTATILACNGMGCYPDSCAPGECVLTDADAEAARRRSINLAANEWLRNEPQVRPYRSDGDTWTAMCLRMQCDGPCEQGRKPCPCPAACQITADDPTRVSGWFIGAVYLISAVTALAAIALAVELWPGVWRALRALF